MRKVGSGSRRWTVAVTLKYEITAEDAEEALGRIVRFQRLGMGLDSDQLAEASYAIRETREDVPLNTSQPPDDLGLDKAIYTAKEVAVILGVSVGTVYERARWRGIDGAIPSLRIGRQVRFPRAGLIELLTSKERG
jgi:excisionase family DNA binding protein